jgi:hypothetical protein
MYYLFQMKGQDLKLMHLMLTYLLKNLNNMKSWIPLNASPLNPDHKINSIHFIFFFYYHSRFFSIALVYLARQLCYFTYKKESVLFDNIFFSFQTKT